MLMYVFNIWCNRTLFFVLICMLFMVYGCEGSRIGTEPGEPDPVVGSDRTLLVNDTILVAYGDTLRNEQLNMWITFDELLQDSRCPIGVWCFWEGNAELSFLVFDSRKVHELVLNSNPSFPTSADIEKYKIHLINVTPYPHIDSLYTPYDYRAQILITPLR